MRGVRIEDAFKRVRLNVRLASGGAHISWESTSLESDVFLFPAMKKSSQAELERVFEQELATWNRIKNSKDIKDWAAYLREYPNGKFSEIAQARLNVLIPMPTPERAAPAVPVGAAKALELKAGIPVPDFYGSLSNPYSAGVYPLGRSFTVGDEASYAVLDPFSKVRQGLDRIRITKVDLDGDRVEINDGSSVSDLMGNMLKIGRVVFDARGRLRCRAAAREETDGAISPEGQLRLLGVGHRLPGPAAREGGRAGGRVRHLPHRRSASGGTQAGCRGSRSGSGSCPA